MKIAIASDHAGFSLKEKLKEKLSPEYVVVDLGTDSSAPVDYPDFAISAALMVQEQKVERAIVLCGSGVGACIAANKVKGVRAAICHDTYSAHQGVEHDDMNVLVLGARIIGEALALEIVQNFLQAQFSNDERHVRRLQKILKLE